MLYLTAACAFLGGVAVTVALLARGIVRNRRRIERLERHERAQDFVIRHIADADFEPEEPEPPPRVPHLFKGAAVLLGVAAVVRAWPARAALAAGSVAVGAGLVVALAVVQSPSPRTGAQGAASNGSSLPGPSSPAAPGSTAPAGPSATVAPSASVSPSAPVSVAASAHAPSVPASAGPGPGSPTPAPVLSVTGLPSVTVTPSPPVTLGPSPSPTPPCAVTVALPPVLDVCVL